MRQRGAVRRIAVLRNPASGRGSARPWAGIRARLGGMRVVETTSAEDLASWSRRLVEEGYDVVAAAGGDGTINGAAQALVGSPTALAVLPTGTGNDFARTLGIGTDLGAALAALGEGRVAEIDVGRWIQGESAGYFVNVAGCGFDAAVADTINRGVRGLRGRSAYLAAIGLTLRRYRPLRLSLVVDGEPLQAEAMLCALANAQSYGAGLRIAPMADLRDGLLDLVLVGPLGRTEFLRNLPGVGTGRHMGHPQVSHRSFRALTIQSAPPSPFLVDGEMLPPGAVGVEVLPQALRCVVPASF